MVWCGVVIDSIIASMRVAGKRETKTQENMPEHGIGASADAQFVVGLRKYSIAEFFCNGLWPNRPGFTFI